MTDGTPTPVATFALSFHAAYACRDSGACCTSGWPIPIEIDSLARADRAIDEGRLHTARDVSVTDVKTVHRDRAQPSAAPAFIRPAGAPPETPARVATTTEGACVFYRHTGAARCEIHRALGHAALPLACRQFPRVSVIDPRGVSITLSHYCPTAAELLANDAPVVIARDPSGFPSDGEYVGLDVRQALPPALRPDMLMTWEAWWRFEREAVSLLASAESTIAALRHLTCVVEHLRTWHPHQGSLNDAVVEAFSVTRNRTVVPRPTSSDTTFGAWGRIDLDEELLAAIPEEHRNEGRRALQRTQSTTNDLVQRRFLMAHVFANWTAHLGEGLRTWLRSIEFAHALVTSGRSVRDTDLLLRHLSDPHVLARTWGCVEHL